MIDKSKKENIIKQLNERLGKFSCPMCHKSNFTFVDGYVAISLQKDYKNIVIGESTFVPSVMIVCNNCGFISQHSLGVLGLIDIDDNNKE